MREEETAGWRQNRGHEQDMVGRAVRKVVWRKVKFLHGTGLDYSVDRSVCKLIADSLNYAVESDEYKFQWHAWIRRYVRTTLTEKRSSVCQSIVRRVVDGESLGFDLFLYMIYPNRDLS